MSGLPAVRCIGCGYDLAGLREDGVCPECAAPVAGSLLRCVSPAVVEYALGLRLGIGLVQMSFGPTALVVVAAGMAPEPLAGAVVVIGGVLSLLGWCLGWVMISARPPAELPGRPSGARDVLFVVSLLELGLGALSVGWVALELFGVNEVVPGGRDAGPLATMAALVLGVTGWVCGMLVLARVAESVLGRAGIGRWCRVIGRMSAPVLLLLPPAAVVLVPAGLVQMWRVRRGLKRMGG